jgi:hypothetical protein
MDCLLVEGEREFDCGAMLHKGAEGCSDGYPGSDEVSVIAVSDEVHGSD